MIIKIKQKLNDENTSENKFSIVILIAVILQGQIIRRARLHKVYSCKALVKVKDMEQQENENTSNSITHTLVLHYQSSRYLQYFSDPKEVIAEFTEGSFILHLSLGES